MATLLSGLSVGPYEILDRLSRGGMADVFLARRQEHDEATPPVVLRVVEYAGADPDALEAERLGATLQERLGEVEPRVPRIHAHGELDDCCFFVEMEFVEGRDLADLLREGPLPWHRAAEIAIEVLDALAAAHAFSTEIDGREITGIVHGDIKPKNIRLTPDGGVRILDFGIARALSLTRRQTRNVFASAAYASPERLNTGDVSEQSDLWAVGVVLYEMLRGRTPFHADTTQRLEGLIRAGEPVPPLPENVCPPALGEVVRRALAPDPAARYANAAAFKADLEAVLAGTQIAPAAGTATRRTVPTNGASNSAVSNGVATNELNGTTPKPAATVAFKDAGGATRRTVPAVIEKPPEKPAKRQKKPVKAKDEKPPTRLQRGVQKTRQVVLRTLVLALVVVTVLEAGVWNQADALRRDLVEGDIAPDAALSRYERLGVWSPLDLGLYPVRAPLLDALLLGADTVIDDYRNRDDASVREGDWQEARRQLLAARSMRGSENEIAARLHYVEGHLDRINERGKDAVMHFREAARLRSRWPDPYLGLAIAHLYLLRDYDAADAALRRLRELGFPTGKREQAQRADIAYFRGLDLAKNCGERGDRGDQKECLFEAREELREAVRGYDEIIPWGRSLENRRHAAGQLDDVESRIAEIRRDEWREALDELMDRWR